MRSGNKLTFVFGLHWSRVFRQWVRRATLQFIEDRVADALRIAAQMRIPEPQRLDAARLQKFFPFQVMFTLVGKTVLAAVQFHIQLRLLAKEIQIIIAERMLAAEFVAAEPPIAQPAPHEFFRPRFGPAKLAGAFNIGHDGNLGNGGKAGKFVLTPALTSFAHRMGEGVRRTDEGFNLCFDAHPHLSPLPQERTCTFTLPFFRMTVRPVPPPEFSKTRRAWLILIPRPSDGRGWPQAGLREDIY